MLYLLSLVLPVGCAPLCPRPAWGYRAKDKMRVGAAEGVLETASRQKVGAGRWLVARGGWQLPTLQSIPWGFLGKPSALLRDAAQLTQSGLVRSRTWEGRMLTWALAGGMMLAHGCAGGLAHRVNAALGSFLVYTLVGNALN